MLLQTVDGANTEDALDETRYQTNSNAANNAEESKSTSLRYVVAVVMQKQAEC